MAGEIMRYKELENLHNSLISNYENRIAELQNRSYSNSQSIKEFYEAKMNESHRKNELVR